MIIVVAGALMALAGTQGTPAPPAARWSLQVEPAHCVLGRQNPDKGLTLLIDTTPGSDSYGMAITGDGIDASASLSRASLTFAPSQRVITGFARVVKLSNKASVLSIQGLPPLVLDYLSGTSTVTLEVEKRIKSIVPVTGTVRAVEALRKCNADQLIEWGADPSQFAPGGIVPAALTPRDEWISNSDLLKLASRSKRSSINSNFRLLVATDGVIAECHATAEVTEPSFEKGACASVVGRRLFSPAKDASGNAVVGAATFRVILIRRPS